MDRIRRRDGDERERLTAQRTRMRPIQEEIRRVREDRRVSCMIQLKTIAQHDSTVLDRHGGRGYVAGLMREIDRLGHEGDAERLLDRFGHARPLAR